jgi:hypothetical protein
MLSISLLTFFYNALSIRKSVEIMNLHVWESGMDSPVSISLDLIGSLESLHGAQWVQKSEI